MAKIKEEIRTEKSNGRVKRYTWYSTQIYIGKSADGKKVYKRFSGRDKNEIIRQIAAAEAELKEAKEKAECVTLGEALDEYIVSRTAVCSPSTIRGYRTVQRNALERLQDMNISEITPLDIQREMNEYAKAYSPKSCRNAHGLISSVLKQYRSDLIIKTKLPQKVKSKIYVPDQHEVRRLYAKLKGSLLEIPFLLASQCGLRASEVAALTLEHVFDDYIEVVEACVPGENNSYCRKGPKSVSGYRKIPISIEMAEKLRSNAVDGNVTSLKSTNISCRWSKLHAEKELELNKNLTFHALRHHFCSKCLLMGMPQKYIAALMGHGSTDMIEKVYEHIFPSAMEEFAQKLRMDMNTLTK